MKLAFIVSGKSPTTMPGGLGSYSYNVAKSFSELGYKVYIVGISDTNELIETEYCSLVHVKSHLRKFASLTSFLMMRKEVSKITQIIVTMRPSQVVIYGAGIWGNVGNNVKKYFQHKHQNPQIEIISLAGYFTTFEHEYAGQIKGVPSQDYGKFNAISLWLLFKVVKLFYVPKEHKTLKQLDAIIVHYESSRNILLDEVSNLPPKHIIKIPYFIDVYERKGKSYSSTESSIKQINCICRQDPRKGINFLLHAIQILRSRNRSFNCVIAGNGPFLEANKKLASALDVADIVSFPGFISSIEDVLSSTDIYVFPSVEEGSGAISLLEAMQAGLAIVTTNCDGIPEDLIHEQTALLVEPENSLALADAIERLLTDSELAERLSKNVALAYQEKYAFEKMTFGFKEVLEALI